jgi:hypothetical protein
MYRLTIDNEQPLTSITLDDVKLFIGITANDEDEMLEKMVNAALRYAEDYTGNVFAKADVTILSSRDNILVVGKIDTEKELNVTVDGNPVDAVVSGNNIHVGYSGLIEVKYSTVENVPPPVAIFIMQETAKMYERGVESIVSPDTKLLSRYVNLAVC